MSDLLDITTDAGWRDLCKRRHDAKLAKHSLFVQVSPERSASQKQLNALEVWCRQLAEVLSSAGLDMRQVIQLEIPPSQHNIKENVYKPVLEAMTGKTSTRDQSTIDPDAVARVIGKNLSERFGITPPPWPSRFNQGMEQ